MTDNKRFHNENNCIGYYTEIIDEQKKLDLTIPNPKKNLLVGELVDLLNALYEENEQLKQRINSRLHFYRGLYESTNDKVVERVIEDLEDILKR